MNTKINFNPHMNDIILSRNNPCFQCNIAITNFLVLHTPERKVASTGDPTHNHQVKSPTRSPLSHPGGAQGNKVYTSDITWEHNLTVVNMSVMTS